VENIKPSKSFNLAKDLMSLGATSEFVEIEGFRFEISTLTERQSKELISSLIAYGEQDRIISSKSHSIALSLKSVNGQSFDEIVEQADWMPEDLETLTAKKIAFIGALQNSVVNKLFEKYSELNNLLADEEVKKKS